MNIYYFILIETIIFISLAFFIDKIIKKLNNIPILRIGNYLLWATIYVLSTLLNLKKYLYFCSLFICVSLITIIFLLKYNFSGFFGQYYYAVYMLVPMTLIVLFSFFITKYFIYNLVNTEAPIGDKGNSGTGGEQGDTYFVETLAEKCYVEIINNLENKYQEIKKSNDIEYNNKDNHINNTYLKNHIKKICYSNNFLDNFYTTKSNNSNTVPECIMKYNNGIKMGRICSVPNQFGIIENCNSDRDCIYVKDSYNKYNEIVNMLKKETTQWLKIILSNNCEENIELRNKLGGNTYETIEDIYDSNTDDYLKYNNKVGSAFLKDYFQNDKYLDNHNNKQINKNPFDTIKNSDIWKWGISPKKNKCI